MDFTQLKALSDWCSDYSQKMNTVSVYIKNHKDEFENHVFYDKMNCNKTYLDDFACELLAKKYNVANSQVISNGQMWDELQSAKQENEALRAEIAEMKENMIPQLVEQVSKQMLSVAMQSIQPLIQQIQQSQQLLLEQKTEESIKVDVPRVALTIREKKAVDKHMDTLKKQMQQLDENSNDYKRKENMIAELEIIKMLGKPVK